MSSRRAERGQTSVLIMGFFLVAVLLTVVVVDASAAFLRRQRLDAVADGAALAAADGVQGEQVYEGGLGERAQIDPVAARAPRPPQPEVPAAGLQDDLGRAQSLTTT